MTEFPELQQALVAAAGRRRRRAPRLARPLIVAVACAAIAAVVLLVARQPSDERAAAPPPDPTAGYAVFQRPATAKDGLPASVSGMPGLHVDDVRLAARNGPWRVYLVNGALDQRPVLCAFAVIGDGARYGCDPAGTVHGYGFPPGDGEPGGIVVTVPDGISEVDVSFDSAGFGGTITDNALLIPVDEWPAGRGTLTWDGGEVPLKSP